MRLYCVEIIIVGKAPQCMRSFAVLSITWQLHIRMREETHAKMCLWVNKMKKYLLPVTMLAIFEAIAVILWLTMDNLFYLFNFSYIGLSIALGIFLFIKKHKAARQVTQFLVGLYMLVYLGSICNENMQIEGFWYYLFTGVF